MVSILKFGSYFVVGADAGGPTLLTGYGGFQVSLTPHYSGVIGRGWLARGGTYAVANIRGGGEYGPGWHRAAQRQHRMRAFEDFAAVAADLVARGITTPQRLGIYAIWMDAHGDGLPEDSTVKPDRIIRSLSELLPD